MSKTNHSFIFSEMNLSRHLERTEQTFGLGVFEPVREEALDRIETFFRERGSDTFH